MTIAYQAKLTAFAVTQRTTKTGKTQFSQAYQLDQPGDPAVVFSRTSMTSDRFPPAGPVTADVRFYNKRVKNDAGYVEDQLTGSFRNIRAYK